MDLFTHFLWSYIMATIYGKAVGGITEPQLLFGVIMGGFPDSDVLLLPLWNRFRRLRHHGITHTIPFQFVLAPILALIIWKVWGLNPLPFIPIGIMAGVFHIICDLITNYPIPIAAPFSWKWYSWSIEAAINPYLMAPSIFFIIVFWNFRITGFPVSVFYATLAIVGLVYTIHLLVKLGIKLHLRHKYKTDGAKVDAYPTTTYFTWYVKIIKNIGGVDVAEYLKVHFGRSHRKTMYYEVEPAHEPPVTLKLPINSEAQAVAYSFSVMKEKLRNLAKEEQIACLVKHMGKDGGFEVFWFRWWARYRFGARGLLVKIRPDGSFDVCQADKKIPT
jgi:membrane-bound metal-dependent hydrolase YbcI (DUF457 family)